MYYHKFPSAPLALVSGISATVDVPTIIDARVGRDNSLYLDIFENENFVVTFEQLELIAEFCGTPAEEVHIYEYTTPKGDRIVSVSLGITEFDFSDHFPPDGYVDDEHGFRAALPGEEDSEEGVEALAALAASRRE